MKIIKILKNLNEWENFGDIKAYSIDKENPSDNLSY